MDLEATLRNRDRIERFRAGPVERARLERVLTAAAITPSFADQSPLRLLVVEDAATKRALRHACEAQRERWFVETPEWIQEKLAHTGEQRRLVSITEAPYVVCIFGETEKPGWREVAWHAAERLRLAALGEGMFAVLVRLEQLGFVNTILDVPQSFTAVSVLALGEADTTAPPAEPGPALENLLLPYEPQEGHLQHWNDPVRLGELARSRDVQRAFLSDKLLLLGIIQTASDVNACTDLDAAFALVTRQLRRILRYDRASVAYVDPDDGKARLRNIHKEIGLPIGENHVVPLEEANVIGWVILNKAGVCRNEIAKEDMFSEQMSAERLRSDMVVPMLADGHVYGTLNVGCYQPNAFTQSDFEILREFGKLLGTAVERLQRNHRNTVIDLLTGLCSHQRFHEQLAKEIERCRHNGLQCALLLVNLDRFSLLNETYGHDLGDKVLTSVARSIRESLREVDVLARFGGEEFIALLPETSAEVLAKVAHRVGTAVDSRVHALHHSKLAVKTTVSIGGAVWRPEDGEADCIAQARAALRRAKRDGRNCFRLFDPALDSVESSRGS